MTNPVQIEREREREIAFFDYNTDFANFVSTGFRKWFFYLSVFVSAILVFADSTRSPFKLSLVRIILLLLACICKKFLSIIQQSNLSDIKIADNY